MAALRAGFARVDITPPLDAAYLSFHPRQTRFAGLHDRLHARAAVVQNDDTALAVVSADSLGFSRSVLGPERDFIEEVRAGVTAATGLPGDHVLVAATHAHSTPQTTDLHDLLGWFPDLQPWVERLRDQLVAAIATAWAGREPVETRAAVGLAPGIAWCRRIVTKQGTLARLPDRPADDAIASEPRDDRVPAILLTGATRRGAIFGFTCHPTTVQVNPLVSADYPGVACALAEQTLGLEAAVFLQGACGNVNPVRHTTDFADVARYGRSLGGELTRLLALLDHPAQPTMSDTLRVARRTITVPRRALPELAPLEETVARLGPQLGDPPAPALLGPYRAAFEARRLVQLGTGPVPLEVQVMRLGEALLVAVEGELFCDFGLQIQAASPAPVSFVVGYANGYQGYFPVREAFEQGGYEPGEGPWTRVDASGGELLTAAAVELAQAVWRG